MPTGLLLLAAVLLVFTFIAFFFGKIAVAGIGLGALFATAATLRDRYRSRAVALHEAGRRESPVEAHSLARGGVLVAMVYPNQRPYLPTLIIEAKPFSGVLIVLAVGLVHDPYHAASEALRVEADRLRREQDAGLLGALEHAIRTAGQPVTLMRAFGADPAASALEIARLICPSRLVILRGADRSAEEQRRLAVLVWESLRPPRPAVRVQMVSTGEEETLAFDLDSAATPPPGRSRG